MRRFRDGIEMPPPLGTSVLQPIILYVLLAFFLLRVLYALYTTVAQTPFQKPLQPPCQTPSARPLLVGV